MSRFNLPSRGQRDWDDELANAFGEIDSSLQVSEATANAASNKANEARQFAEDAVNTAAAAEAAANQAVGLATAPTDAAVNAVLTNPASDASATLSAKFAAEAAPRLSGKTLSDTLLPMASPVETSLTFSAQYAALGLSPRSIGADGWVYGTLNNTTLWRSGDALATRDTSTTTFTGKSVLWVSRVTEGYCALVSNAGNGELWFSTDWETGWTLKQSIGKVGALSCPHPKRGPSGTVLLVGEYVTGAYPSTAMYLWLSQDGGQTWVSVKSSTATNTNVNTHWHASDYDEKRQRIWACNGDGVNSWFGYSDDFGATWTGAPFDASSPLYDGIAYQQPTTIMVVEDHLILTPDRGAFPSGVWVMDADTLAIESRYALPGGEQTEAQYGLGAYYGRRGKEIYLTFPDTGSGNKLTYIIASGDYGRSWHLAETIAWGSTGGSLSTGIIGPDMHGRLYFKGESLPTYGSGIAWADSLTWEWATPTA